MPDWILHHVDYSSLLISLEMDLKQVLQGDLPVLPPAGASLPLIREEKQILGFIALTKLVQVLSLALKGFLVFLCSLCAGQIWNTLELLHLNIAEK